MHPRVGLGSPLFRRLDKRHSKVDSPEHKVPYERQRANLFRDFNANACMPLTTMLKYSFRKNKSARDDNSGTTMKHSPEYPAQNARNDCAPEKTRDAEKTAPDRNAPGHPKEERFFSAGPDPNDAGVRPEQASSASVATCLAVDIQSQPDDVTCGPTCLHAVYRYFGDHIPLEKIVREIKQLRDGGTVAPILGCHALCRGYKATLFTFDLKTFDPTWLMGDHAKIPAKLKAQMNAKPNRKLHAVSNAYLEFLSLGGALRFEDLTRALIRRILHRHAPILVGLSSTYLYREMREIPSTNEENDIHGLPAGHFVVLHGYDPEKRIVYIADPYGDNPLAGENGYGVPIDRVICAILLGIVTYDANLLVIEPKTIRKKLP